MKIAALASSGLVMVASAAWAEEPKKIAWNTPPPADCPVPLVILTDVKITKTFLFRGYYKSMQVSY